MQRFFLAFAIALSTHDDCYREFQACTQRAQTIADERVCHLEAAVCFQKGSSGRSSLRR